jgi:hypothetical protein
VLPFAERAIIQPTSQASVHRNHEEFKVLMRRGTVAASEPDLSLKGGIPENTRGSRDCY